MQDFSEKSISLLGCARIVSVLCASIVNLSSLITNCSCPVAVKRSISVLVICGKPKVKWKIHRKWTSPERVCKSKYREYSALFGGVRKSFRRDLLGKWRKLMSCKRHDAERVPEVHHRKHRKGERNCRETFKRLLDGTVIAWC